MAPQTQPSSAATTQSARTAVIKLGNIAYVPFTLPAATRPAGTIAPRVLTHHEYPVRLSPEQVEHVFKTIQFGAATTRPAAATTRPVSGYINPPVDVTPEQVLEIVRLQAAGTRPAVAVTTNPSEVVATRPTSIAATRPAEPGLPWVNGLKDGLEQAKQNSKPILVRVGAEWCAWCRKLEGEIGKAEAQKELGRWTLVYVDVDRAGEEIEPLGIGPIPAMRVLTPAGRVVASQDGYVTADALVSWLGKQYGTASVSAPEELKSDGVPDADVLVKLLAQFENRDPVLREAAIRRLSPYPEQAAVAVVNAFATGRLAARLTALELLEAWKAPIQEMDPWRPDTLNEAKIKGLKDWAARSGKTPATRPEHLDDRTRATARKELAAYMQAGTPAEVQAIRERLARYGLALLPAVLEQLKTAENDAARERLNALRYRLAAGDALALRWPGGFERLASLSAPVCQKAVEELTRSAGPGDVALLLQLFGHPDPLVREITLRALQSIGGTETTDALVRLLQDPEPNVRAAVLKQLAEKPNRQLVPQIAEYVKTEKDSDLIVHAVRFLREAKGDEAVDCLTSLLAHESWRVRAEAAEAIGQCISGQQGVSAEKKADVYVALIKLLDDSDGFVVSRAVTALRGSDLSAAMEPLGRAAARHPELAGEITELMSQNNNARSRSLTQLRKFISNPDPTVRAAAIGGLASSDPRNIEKEMLAAIQDPESSVRIAAARALMQVLETYRPGPERERVQAAEVMVVEQRGGILGALFGTRRVVTTRPVAPVRRESGAESQPASQPAGGPELDKVSAWLLEFRMGRGRPEWMIKLVPPLEKMLAAQSAEERMAGAIPLIALGAEERALPVLMAEIVNTPAVQSQSIQALPWLPWEWRLELFNQLLNAGSNADHLNELAMAMAKVPDPRAADPLWDLPARQNFDEDTLQTVFTAINTLYFGERYYNPEGVPAARRRVAAAAAKKRVETGTSLQRVLGLAVLLGADKDAAGELADRLLKDPAVASDLQLRRDSCQVLLLSQSGAKARQAAMQALSSEIPEMRQMGLTYLAMGRGPLSMLRGRMYLPVTFRDPEDLVPIRTGQPIQPEAPQGLTAEMVRPFLTDRDSKMASYAGYLLALLGQADGLEPLVGYWRQHGKTDEALTRLVFRAIAALGDDAHVPVIEEIYGQIGKEDYRMREFYWTIRVMKGPEAMKLREKIRREVGTQQLR